MNLTQLVDEKDALALGARSWLHDPRCVGVLPELLLEDYVVAGQDVRHRNNVQVDEVALLIALGDWIVLFFHILSETLEVFYHQIFPREFEVIWVMVQ